MTNKESIAWYAQFDIKEDDEGLFPEEPEQKKRELEALAEMGAPDVSLIEITSIVAEDRDDFIVEANVTKAFADWAREPSELHGTRLPLLD